jgi:hypothetical protein
LWKSFRSTAAARGASETSQQDDDDDCDAHVVTCPEFLFTICRFWVFTSFYLARVEGCQILSFLAKSSSSRHCHVIQSFLCLPTFLPRPHFLLFRFHSGNNNLYVIGALEREEEEEEDHIVVRNGSTL